MKYDNPPNMVIVNLSLSIATILVTLGFIGLLIDWGPYGGWAAFLTMIGLASLYLSAIWYRQYYTRPKIVEIVDDGLTLYMSSSKEIKLGWSDVLGYWANSEETDAPKTKAGSGGIYMMSGPFYTTNYYIAITVASEYHRVTRKILPATTANESDREFKKRISSSRIN